MRRRANREFARDGRPRATGPRRNRISRQNVVITALTVISNYCDQVTDTPPASLPGRSQGNPGRPRKTGIRDARTKAESAGGEEYASPDGNSADGIYPGQSGLAIRGPLA